MIRILPWLLLALGTTMSAHATPPDDGLLYPRIARFGGVADIGAHPAAEPERMRRLLFDLDMGGGDGLHPGLEAVARLLNLYALAGIPNERVEVVVLLRGKATSLALRADAFAARSGQPHRNTGLRDALLDAGVHFEVCGQALHRNGYTAGEVDPRIAVALGAVLRRETLLAQGYVLAR